jgi:hypothetical protein
VAGKGGWKIKKSRPLSLGVWEIKKGSSLSQSLEGRKGNKKVLSQLEAGSLPSPIPSPAKELAND